MKPHNKAAALATILRALTENPEGVTKARLAALLGVSEKTIEHDLTDLRKKLGYPIEYNNETQGYFLDKTRMITCSLEGNDMRLLHAASAGAVVEGNEEATAVLRNAVAKLQASTDLPPRAPDIAGRTPPDESLVRLASAIEQHHTLRLEYQGTRNFQAQVREFAPAFIFETARSYYVSGLAYDSDHGPGQAPEATFDELEGPSARELAELDGMGGAPLTEPTGPQWRTLKLSRINAASIEESARGAASGADISAGRAKADAFFFVHDVRLAIRPGCAQAVRGVMEADSNMDGVPEGWDCVRIGRIDRSFLIEKLMTYGTDIRVLAPASFREEWIHILEHLGGL